MVHLFWNCDLTDKNGVDFPLHVQSKGLPNDPELVRRFLVTKSFPGAKKCSLPVLVTQAGSDLLVGNPFFDEAGKVTYKPADNQVPINDGKPAPTLIAKGVVAPASPAPAK